jgi:hypothetical protein
VWAEMDGHLVSDASFSSARRRSNGGTLDAKCKGGRTVEHARTEAVRLDDPARATDRPRRATSTTELTRLNRRKNLELALWDPLRTLDWRWKSALDIAQSPCDVLTPSTHPRSLTPWCTSASADRMSKIANTPQSFRI